MDRSGHNGIQTVEQTNWQIDGLTERVAGRQTGSRFGLYDLLLHTETYTNTHAPVGISRPATEQDYLCHGRTGIPSSVHAHTHAHIHITP